MTSPFHASTRLGRILRALAFGAVALVVDGCGGDGADDVRVRSEDQVAQARGLSDPSPRASSPEPDGSARWADAPGTPTLRPDVADYYADSSSITLWTDADGIRDDARELVGMLGRSGREGLDPGRYHVRAIRAAIDEAEGDPTPESLARTELLLSDGFVRFASDLLTGRVDRREAEVDWELERTDSLGAGSTLDRIREGAAPADVLDSVRPRLPVYPRLVDALARYRDIERGGGWPSVPADASVQEGDSGPAVVAVRERLTAGGSEEERRLAATGTADPRRFDADLTRAVEHYQRRHGLAVDGIAGDETVEAMNVPASERVEALVLNLDRIRWLPRRMGERAVLVNVAGFELRVLEAGEPVMRMGVVVGRPEWRTAVLSEPMEHLIFNPYWHVPESIERAEILPAVREDRGYLRAENLSVVEPDAPFGPPVPPSSVDFDRPSDAFPYDLRQEPGPGNALGRVKFMFPNEHAIYLHDTPADHLFEKNFRAFSHGCIRVERPWELARWVLEHATHRPPTHVEELRASDERTRVELREPIPVYIAYVTAWAGRDGTVSFYEDLYDRDDPLEERVDG